MQGNKHLIVDTVFPFFYGDRHTLVPADAGFAEPVPSLPSYHKFNFFEHHNHLYCSGEVTIPASTGLLII